MDWCAVANVARLQRAVAKVEGLVRLAGASSVQGGPAWRLKLFLSDPERVEFWDKSVRGLPLDVEAANPARPYAVGKHHVAPQVESCSASRDEFLDVWVNFLADVFGPEYKDTHFVFVFDPEYVPHYISWLYDKDAARTLLNTILCPHKFHFRKHVAEVNVQHYDTDRERSLSFLFFIIMFLYLKHKFAGCASVCTEPEVLLRSAFDDRHPDEREKVDRGGWRCRGRVWRRP